MKRNLIILVSLLGLVAGCTAPALSPVPTPYPPEYLPTVIVLTANAANVIETETALASTPLSVPTDTLEITVSSTPWRPPGLSFTETPTPIPWHAAGAVQFISPGPMSKLVSPIQLVATVVAGESEKVQIDLYGEDGRLLSRAVRLLGRRTKGALLSLKITFEIRAAAELGRITISTLDESGRIQALNSVRVLLLSSGVNEINPPGNPSEPVLVFSPMAEEAVSGGVLNIKGDIWPFSIQPIVLELISPEGKSIGLRVITVEDINPQLFETSIPYKVTEPTSARLIIRQSDDHMPGRFYIYSQVVLLNP
jgi:hypothetical protein